MLKKIRAELASSPIRAFTTACRQLSLRRLILSCLNLNDVGAIELSLASVDDQVALLLEDCKSRKEQLERIRKRSVYSTDASTYCDKAIDSVLRTLRQEGAQVRRSANGDKWSHYPKIEISDTAFSMPSQAWNWLTRATWYLLMLPWALLVLLTTFVILAGCLGIVVIPLVACAALPILAGGALINYFLWLAGIGDGYSYWPYTTLSVLGAIGVVVYLVNSCLSDR
jgi:hypothetical protein